MGLWPATWDHKKAFEDGRISTPLTIKHADNKSSNCTSSYNFNFDINEPLNFIEIVPVIGPDGAVSPSLYMSLPDGGLL